MPDSSGDVVCKMQPLCSSLMLRLEGERLTQVGFLTLQICINIKWMEQAALCCCSSRTKYSGVVEERAFKRKLEAPRQLNKTSCFSSESSNCTSSHLCLLVLGNWVALLSRCDSSAAHYSSCCQRKEVTTSAVFDRGHYNGSVPEVEHGKRHLWTMPGRQSLQSHEWCTHVWLKYSETWHHALSSLHS